MFRAHGQQRDASVLRPSFIDAAEKKGEVVADRRAEMWQKYLLELAPTSGAEIGVWKGFFAEKIVARVPSFRTYHLVDPWAHLTDWNKPFNVDNDSFDQIFAQAMNRTRDAHGDPESCFKLVANS